MPVFQGFILIPWTVAVEKVDPFANGRMGGAPDLVEHPRTRIAQILLLQDEKAFARRLIVLGDLKPKTVRFVL